MIRARGMKEKSQNVTGNNIYRYYCLVLHERARRIRPAAFCLMPIFISVESISIFNMIDWCNNSRERCGGLAYSSSETSGTRAKRRPTTTTTSLVGTPTVIGHLLLIGALPLSVRVLLPLPKGIRLITEF